MNRKALLAAALVLGGLSCWAAGQADAGAASKAGPVTITVWDFKYGEVTGAQPALMEMDKQFMAKYPSIKVNHVAQPAAPDYYQVVRAAVTAQSGPDVLMFHGDGKAYEFDQFQLKLDDMIKPWRAEIPETTWIKCATGMDPAKGIKLVPITIQGQGIYYNKQLFAKAGLDAEKPPVEWADFLAACDKLKAAGITPILYAGQPATTVNFLLRLFSANLIGDEGARDFATGKRKFTDPEFVQAAKAIRELRDRGYFDPEGPSLKMFMDVRDKFSAGKGAMVVGLLSDVAHWKDFSDGLGKANVGYFPNVNLPGAKYKDRQYVQGAGIGYSLMSWSKNVEPGMKFAEFYARDGAPVFLAMTGALVPNARVSLDKVDYPVLKRIMGFMGTNSVDSFVTYVPGSVITEGVNRLGQPFCNSAEMSAEEFARQLQKKLDDARANK